MSDRCGICGVAFVHGEPGMDAPGGQVHVECPTRCVRCRARADEHELFDEVCLDCHGDEEGEAA